MCHFIFFFLNDTPPTEISTLPLHAALPIPVATPIAPRQCTRSSVHTLPEAPGANGQPPSPPMEASKFVTPQDRKSTRLNSSHLVISYAVFCLKKKKKIMN